MSRSSNTTAATSLTNLSVMHTVSVALPTAMEQRLPAALTARDGVRVQRNDLQPGDLVFFQGRSGRGGIGHVGIVTRVNADNTFHFIHSACSSGVTESKNTESYYSRRYVGACRVL